MHLFLSIKGARLKQHITPVTQNSFMFYHGICVFVCVCVHMCLYTGAHVGACHAVAKIVLKQFG